MLVMFNGKLFLVNNSSTVTATLTLPTGLVPSNVTIYTIVGHAPPMGTHEHMQFSSQEKAVQYFTTRGFTLTPLPV